MKVKPVNPNAVIRDPHTRLPLPADGAEVPDNNFWNRRLLDGDVVRIDAPTKPQGNEPVATLTTRGRS